MTAMPPPPSQPPSQPVPAPQQPAGRYATWGSRAIAWLIDGAIVGAIAGVGIMMVAVAAAGTAAVSEGAGNAEPGAAGGVFLVLGLGLYAVAIGFNLWNQGWRQGETGQSIGKSVMKISVIRDTGEFMGGGLGIGRLLVNWIVGGACALNYLWPLWDDRVQTWADKIVSTIVVETAP
ncbi:MAG TPA: RDD family protein [Nitriliruptoraceae bacterium]|nr:RDD family protein [Nitriliruptoraceae bacterium]